MYPEIGSLRFARREREREIRLGYPQAHDATHATHTRALTTPTRAFRKNTTQKCMRMHAHDNRRARARWGRGTKSAGITQVTARGAHGLMRNCCCVSGCAVSGGGDQWLVSVCDLYSGRRNTGCARSEHAGRPVWLDKLHVPNARRAGACVMPSLRALVPHAACVSRARNRAHTHTREWAHTRFALHMCEYVAYPTIGVRSK